MPDFYCTVPGIVKIQRWLPGSNKQADEWLPGQKSGNGLCKSPCEAFPNKMLTCTQAGNLIKPRFVTTVLLSYLCRYSPL